MASTGEEHGLFWNSETGDRTYDANSFEYWLKKFFTSGVFEGDLQVQATSGMTLKVGSGYANTDGKVKFWNAEFSIVLDAANSTYPRIDTIVITRDNVNRTITCEKVTGAYSVDAPQPTPPVRDSETWQLVIAQIYVPAGATGITQSNITDTRPDPDLCGYITGTVTEMDFSQFAAQFEAYYNEFVAGHEADFDTWEAQQQAAYAAWYAEVVAQMQDDHEAFEDWFENLQNQLDTDQLTHLQAQIDDIYTMLPAGSHITVTTEETTLYSMDVTISDGTHTITSEFDNNGVAIFKTLPYVGNFLISSTDGNDTAKTTINISYFGRYAYEIAFWNAYVNIDGGDELAGATVTVTNSEDTVVGTVTLNNHGIGQFNAKEPDIYTFSTEYLGETITSEVDIYEQGIYNTELIIGWVKWVQLGGLDPSNYESLAEVLADEAAVRRLMTVHASADFLISQVNADITVLDDFTASDNAMKWIGLRDYVCDGLTNIAGVEAEFMASDYWERYLKDHVPVMTSNTAPYGVASATTTNSGNEAYKAFDSDLSTAAIFSSNTTNNRLVIKFTNPICVKRMYWYSPKGQAAPESKPYKIQGSNDGSTWVDLYSGVNSKENVQVTADIDNNNYYLYYGVFCPEIMYVASTWSYGFYGLQFYGRSLNVSVPAMTSSAAPYGEAISSGFASGYEEWKAFDNSTSTEAGVSQGNGGYIGYKFTKPVCIKGVYIYQHQRLATFKVQGSNDGITWSDVSDIITMPQNNIVFAIFENDDSYQYYRILQVTTTIDGNISYYTIQFYGLDYSEREFATGSTMKYLYDHGLELEEIGIYTQNGTIEKRDSSLYVQANSGNYNAEIHTNNTIDLTAYSLYRIEILNIFRTCILRIANAIPVNYGDGTKIVAQSEYLTPITSPDNLALDISNINQNDYVTVSTGSNGSTEVVEMWLE